MFKKKVDRRSRKAMTDFLRNHFRYDTMNSWNGSTSYANNVKIYNLGLTSEQSDTLYRILCDEDLYDEVSYMISEDLDDFGRNHDWKWQVGFNGRSSGYLVLYQGDWKFDEHKSFCTACGQKNFTSILQTGKKCGRCGKETRVDIPSPVRIPYVYSGKSTDMNEDFKDFSMSELKARVALVEEFDALCDTIREKAAWIADSYEIEEEEYLVPVKRSTLVEKAS